VLLQRICRRPPAKPGFLSLQRTRHGANLFVHRAQHARHQGPGACYLLGDLIALHQPDHLRPKATRVRRLPRPSAITTVGPVYFRKSTLPCNRHPAPGADGYLSTVHFRQRLGATSGTGAITGTGRPTPVARGVRRLQADTSGLGRHRSRLCGLITIRSPHLVLDSCGRPLRDRRAARCPSPADRPQRNPRTEANRSIALMRPGPYRASTTLGSIRRTGSRAAPADRVAAPSGLTYNPDWFLPPPDGSLFDLSEHRSSDGTGDAPLRGAGPRTGRRAPFDELRPATACPTTARLVRPTDRRSRRPVRPVPKSGPRVRSKVPPKFYVMTHNGTPGYDRL